MFVGRENEIAELERAHSSEGFRLLMIQGGRGAGKSTLLERFCRGKKAVTYSPVLGDSKANLARFSWLILRLFGDEMHPAFKFWEEALNYIAAAGKSERTVIAIDDADILAARMPVVMKVFAKALDSALIGSKILLIFSCVNPSFLETYNISRKVDESIHLGKFLTEQNAEILKREELKRTPIQQAKFIQIPADTVITHEGEMNGEMYKIISGRAVCTINNGTDNEYILGSFNEGKTFGEYSLITGKPGIYTVTAFTDMLLLRISRGDFMSFIQMNAENSVNIMRNMAAMMNVMKVNIDMLNGELNPAE